MAGPYLQVAFETAPNYEGAANAVSSDVFYPFVKTVSEDAGQENFEENDVIPSTLDPLPHKGAASYVPTMKLGEIHPRPADLALWLALRRQGVPNGARVPRVPRFVTSVATELRHALHVGATRAGSTHATVKSAKE